MRENDARQFYAHGPKYNIHRGQLGFDFDVGGREAIGDSYRDGSFYRSVGFCRTWSVGFLVVTVFGDFAFWCNAGGIWTTQSTVPLHYDHMAYCWRVEWSHAGSSLLHGQGLLLPLFVGS